MCVVWIRVYTPWFVVKIFDCFDSKKKWNKKKRLLPKQKKPSLSNLCIYFHLQKVQCPLCDRRVVNLNRHLVQVEKLPRQEFEDLMNLTRRKRVQAKKDGEKFNIPDHHPQSECVCRYQIYIYAWSYTKQQKPNKEISSIFVFGGGGVEREWSIKKNLFLYLYLTQKNSWLTSLNTGGTFSSAAFQRWRKRSLLSWIACWRSTRQET